MKNVADSPKRSPRTALWVVVMIGTIVASVLLILAWGHWWPSGGDWYFTAAAAILLLLIAGGIWVVSSVVAVVRYRTWSWWMVAWPLTAVAGIGLAFASAPSFDDARPQFEEVAQQLLASPDPATLGTSQIGRFEVRRIYDTPTGEVYFVDARQSLFGNESGWIYSPDHIPGEWAGNLTVENFTTGWYRYQLVSNL